MTFHPHHPTKLLDCLVNALEVVLVAMLLFVNYSTNKSITILFMSMTRACIIHLWYLAFFNWSIEESRAEELLSLWCLWFIAFKKNFLSDAEIAKSRDRICPAFCVILSSGVSLTQVREEIPTKHCTRNLKSRCCYQTLNLTDMLDVYFIQRVS